MTKIDIDQAYSDICARLTAVGQDNAVAFLSRFSLLALLQLREDADLGRMLDQAARGLEAGD